LIVGCYKKHLQRLIMKNAAVGAGDFGVTGLKTSPPTVADTVPLQFRHALIEASLADAEWLRPPPPRGRCRLTGLSRSSLIQLGDAGLIKLIRLRKPGAQRGLILIEKESLLGYLRTFRPEGESEGEAE
jgi:hypothetical protein